VVLEALDGVERPLRPPQRFQARVGDRLLLCSDGVTDYLSDAEVAELLKTSDASIAVRRIIGSALAHGSRDNITAVIADIVTRARPHDSWLDSLPLASNPE
jgi:PPM family protein phosphatase